MWPGHVFARDGAMHVARGAGEEAEAVGDRRHLVLQNANPRLARIQRFENGERFGIAVDGIGELQQQARPLGGGGARPGLEGLGRGLNGGIDLGRRGIGKRDDRLLGLGIDHGLRRLGAGNEFRANQHVRVEHRMSSTCSLATGYFDDPPVCSPSRVR